MEMIKVRSELDNGKVVLGWKEKLRGIFLNATT